MSFSFGNGSFLLLAGLIHVPGGGHLHHRLVSTAEPAVGWHSACHHHPQHQEWGSSSSSVLALAQALAKHHTHRASIPLLPRCSECPGPATFASSAPRIGGPSCSVRLIYDPVGILAQRQGQQEAAVCGSMATALVLPAVGSLAAAMAWWLWSSLSDGLDIM